MVESEGGRFSGDVGSGGRTWELPRLSCGHLGGSGRVQWVWGNVVEVEDGGGSLSLSGCDWLVRKARLEISTTCCNACFNLRCRRENATAF